MADPPGTGIGVPTASVPPDAGARMKPAASTLLATRSPRDAPLPHQEPAARASHLHRAPVDRASGPAHRPGRLVLGRHLVIGLRHRADAPSPDPDHRRGRVLVGHPHQPRRDLRPSLRDALVPRGGQGVHQGRRGLRGGPRELRPQRRPGGRHVVAHRLHVDGGGVGGGRRGRDHLRGPEPGPLYDVDRHRPGHPPRLREPARHSRGRPHVRRPHLLLHRQHGAAHRLGHLQGGDRVPARPSDHRAPRLGPHRVAGQRTALRSHRVRAAQGVRLGRLGPDRDGGHLQRRERLPQAGVAQRPDHHGLDGHDPRVPRPRGLRARHPSPTPCPTSRAPPR